MLTLEEMKKALKVDYDDDDDRILRYMRAAEEEIANSIDVDDTIKATESYGMLVEAYVTAWYQEGVSAVTEKKLQNNPMVKGLTARLGGGY